MWSRAVYDLEHRPEPGAVGVLQEVGGLGEPGVPAGVPGGQHVGLIPPGEQLGSVALAERLLVQAGLMSHRPASVPARRCSLAGFLFPPEVIMLAVRWYLRQYSDLVAYDEQLDVLG